MVKGGSEEWARNKGAASALKHYISNIVIIIITFFLDPTEVLLCCGVGWWASLPLKKGNFNVRA